MKINKPNILSISIFYLAAALWSESQCGDDLSSNNQYHYNQFKMQPITENGASIRPKGQASNENTNTSEKPLLFVGLSKRTTKKPTIIENNTQYDLVKDVELALKDQEKEYIKQDLAESAFPSEKSAICNEKGIEPTVDLSTPLCSNGQFITAKEDNYPQFKNPKSVRMSTNEIAAIGMEKITKHPYDAIVSLECYFENGAVYGGTGFFIDENCILTAVHVIFDEEYGFAKSIVCYSGIHGYGGESYKKIADVTKFAYSNFYKPYLDLYKVSSQLINTEQFNKLNKSNSEVLIELKNLDRDNTSIEGVKEYKTIMEMQRSISENLSPIIKVKNEVKEYSLKKFVEYDYAILSVKNYNIPTLDQNSGRRYVNLGYENGELSYWLRGYPTEDYTNKNKKHHPGKAPYEIELSLFARDESILYFQTPQYDKEKPLYEGMSGGLITQKNNGVEELGVGIITNSIKSENKVMGCHFSKEKINIVNECIAHLSTLNSHVPNRDMSIKNIGLKQEINPIKLNDKTIQNLDGVNKNCNIQ
jgi:hypothetical protein